MTCMRCRLPRPLKIMLFFAFKTGRKKKKEREPGLHPQCIRVRTFECDDVK